MAVGLFGLEYMGVVLPFDGCILQIDLGNRELHDVKVFAIIDQVEIPILRYEKKLVYFVVEGEPVMLPIYSKPTRFSVRWVDSEEYVVRALDVAANPVSEIIHRSSISEMPGRTNIGRWILGVSITAAGQR